MDPLLDVLNPAQREAVQAGEGPILVLAGPGSGKTRVLTHRVAYLVGRVRIAPYRIMAVTFTNKAAREMKTRLIDLIGEAGLRDLTIGTFHATCASILRRDGAAIGLDPHFLIYDTADQETVAKRALQDLNLDDKQYRPGAMLAAISDAKNAMQTPSDLRPKNYRQEIVQRVYTRYEELLAENNALDFDDLLIKVVRLWREAPDILGKYRRRYQSVLVDEFQDTNLVQYELVHLLAQEARHVFVVGDEDQSIYSWRGADFRNVRRFLKDFPEAQTILLEQNYRSTQTILDAAASVIRHNVQRTDKSLWTENAQGQPITLYEAYDEHEEAQFVADEIGRLAARGQCRYRECAVMYRTNAQSRVLEEEFLHRSLPYRVVGAMRFYGRREVKDVLAYLRLVYNPDDTASLDRILNVPARGIGPKTVATFRDWAEAEGLTWHGALERLVQDQEAAPVDARSRRALLAFYEMVEELRRLATQADLLTLFDRTLARSGYAAYVQQDEQEGEERWRNIQELRSVASEYQSLPPDEALAAFLTNVALVADVDTLQDEADAVTLLTLHAAKGLEFRTVFLVGLEENLLPHSRSRDNPDQLEEERRLCYVGLTRAKERLYLTYTFRRNVFGNQELSSPSPFLLDIPDRLLRRPGGKGPARPTPLRERPAASRPPAAPVSDMRRSYVPRRSKALPPSSYGREEVSPTATPAAAAVPRYSPGDRVLHPAFGRGTVVASTVKGGDEEVTVAFEGKGVKKLLASYARMERVE